MTYRERKLREEREWLRARYDNGAVNQTVFTAMKEIECDIAWMNA